MKGSPYTTVYSTYWSVCMRHFYSNYKRSIKLQVNTTLRLSFPDSPYSDRSILVFWMKCPQDDRCLVGAHAWNAYFQSTDGWTLLKSASSSLCAGSSMTHLSVASSGCLSSRLGISNMAAGLAAGQEVTWRRGCVSTYVRWQTLKGHTQTAKTRSPSGLGLLSPRTRAELKGWKVHPQGRRKVGEAVMQKSDMKTGWGAGAGLARAKVTEDK